MKLKPIIYGLLSFIPGVENLRRSFQKTGGTCSSRYCYSVWLRHLVMADKAGLNTCPAVVAELGPGDSLGIGLMALLTGSEKLYAFDVINFTSTNNNLKVFDELIILLKGKEKIPDDVEFPRIKPYLDDYTFPKHILNDERLEESLSDLNIEKIRNAISQINTPKNIIQYKVPWFEDGVLQKESVDMIFSQAVLEHVDDLDGTYSSMKKWLKPDGFISHQIDFKCHATATEWNGHWAYSDFMWFIIRGRRAFHLNRETCSIHLKKITDVGFKVLVEIPVVAPSNLTKNDLPKHYKDVPESDMTISGLFIQCSN
jgi:hypothetical protein